MHRYFALKFAFHSPNSFTPVITQTVRHILTIRWYFYLCDRLHSVAEFFNFVLLSYIPIDDLPVPARGAYPFVVSAIKLHPMYWIHFLIFINVFCLVAFEGHNMVEPIKPGCLSYKAWNVCSSIDWSNT